MICNEIVVSITVHGFIYSPVRWLGREMGGKLSSAALLKVHSLLVNRDLRPSVKDETMTQFYPIYQDINIDRKRTVAHSSISTKFLYKIVHHL